MSREDCYGSVIHTSDHNLIFIDSPPESSDARYRDLYGNAGGIVTDKRSRDPKGKPKTRIDTSGRDAREVKTTLAVDQCAHCV